MTNAIANDVLMASWNPMLPASMTMSLRVSASYGIGALVSSMPYSLPSNACSTASCTSHTDRTAPWYG